MKNSVACAWLIIAPIAIAGGVLAFIGFKVAAQIVKKPFSG